MLKPVLVLGLTVSLASAARAQYPACVIDAVKRPLADCMNIIPADRIAGIQIYKGPDAVSRFGADAEHGVIFVTLKPGAAATMGEDPLARYLFPPELVMQHQQAIALQEQQRVAIQQAMQEAQAKFIELQFQMSAELEKLQRLLQSTRVEQAKALEQVDRVLAQERDVKHAQLLLMMKIKNQLTEQQQAVLAKLRRP
jgi:hypothetical protein